MSVTGTVFFVLAGYFAGSVPFGLVLTRLITGEDVRRVGSGNIGASNVTRAAGKAAGALTLLFDAAKAAVPMLLARSFSGGGPRGELLTLGVGLAAFFGHLYPVWLRFRGGKGVATALGVFLVLAPLPSALALLAFAAVYAKTRIPALGSLVGTAVCCLGTFVQTFLRLGREAFLSPLPWVVLALSAVIVLRHRSNIARLKQGKEHRA
ncbi:MAG TPA: glycerol-3-phosphate 1-O-acyltransferase PlsY [Anaeromyxobacteraceae bacterium]|nr:glycerol-3-phosphate 1-O-acyltransferase PlsY [Anaeromyxobacteraceae bacterium]